MSTSPHVRAERHRARLELREHGVDAGSLQRHARHCADRIEPCTSTTSSAAGARVQRVDVLRDDRLDEPAPLELREREVRRVRLGVEEQVDPLP